MKRFADTEKNRYRLRLREAVRDPSSPCIRCGARDDRGERSLVGEAPRRRSAARWVKGVAIGFSLCLAASIAHAQSGSLGIEPGVRGPGVINGSGCLTSGTALLKGNGSGGCGPASAGVDFAPAPPSNFSLLKGNGSGGFASAVAGTDYQAPIAGQPITPSSVKAPVFTSSGNNPASSALLNDVNNHIISAARNAENTADVPVASVGLDDQIHFGGSGATGISFDSPSVQNQGAFTASAYLDAPDNNNAYTGGTINCQQNVHNFVLAANATITLACTGMNNQTQTFFLIQPKSGSVYTYTFAAANGATLLGDTPTACNVNGCIDEVQVIWIPSQTDYIINLEKANLTGIATCPVGQTCYYVASPTDTPAGNDSNSGTSPSAPWATTNKADSILSTLNPGDEVLFKGGDTWTGGGSNGVFLMGDTAAHKVTGTAAKRILISTYGTGRATIDANNVNYSCFSALNPGNNVSYVTISNFECKHAWSIGINFETSSSSQFAGITISNNYVHDTGPGCATQNGACVGTDGWPNWASGTAYTSATYIEPTSGNGSNYVFNETVASCTSSGGPITWPQTAGQTVTDGSCSWVNTGIAGNYKNQINFEDDAHNPHSVNILNNIVNSCGGHNCLQVHYDTGSPLVQGNQAGPGCVHNCLDVKGVGSTLTSPATVAQIVGNVSTCGYSRALCGTTQTVGLYTENSVIAVSANELWELNTVYDDGVAMQIVPSAISSGSGNCTNSTGECPIAAKYYNNTVYGPTGIANSWGLYGGGGNGTRTNSSIDARNDIFDGFGTDSVDIPGTWGTHTEDYNDIGGSQGSPGFIFNSGSTKGAHDVTNVDPLYQCELTSTCGTATPPAFQLQATSPLKGIGNPSLGTGNTNIGAY